MVRLSKDVCHDLLELGVVRAVVVPDKVQNAISWLEASIVAGNGVAGCCQYFKSVSETIPTRGCSSSAS